MKKSFTASDLHDASETLQLISNLRQETKTLKQALEKVTLEDLELLVAISKSIVTNGETLLKKV